MKDIRKKEPNRKIASRRKENTLDDINDEDDDLLILREKRQVEENSAVSKFEREIKELETFSNISAFPSSSLCPVASSPAKNHSKRRRKVIDKSSSKSFASHTIIDSDTLEADDSIFRKNKVFIVEPHCSIQISDFERRDTCIKRWKMNEAFTNIVKLYASNWSCSLESVILLLRNGKRISAVDTPRSVAFSEKDINYLSVYKNSQNENCKTNKITVKWLLPERNKPIITAIPRDTSFIILKRDFAIDNGLDERKLTLVFDSERINPQETVRTLGIEDGDCIDVYIKSIFGRLCYRSFIIFLYSETTAMIFRHEKLHTDLFQCLWIPLNVTRLYSTSTIQSCNEQRDLYQILGIDSSATTKEIKAAYYQLSKIYHPDRHDDKEQKNLAAEKFLQVAEAYEILSSDEKRKAYDKKCQENWIQTPIGSWPTQMRVKKNFEDLGLDYKTFEDFQRSVKTRKQRTKHDHWQMPDEFFAHFGSPREFTNTFRPRSATYFTYSYKDPMQRQREMREWQILKEIEEEKRKSKYKTPAFVVMERERRRRELSEKRTLNILLLFFGCISMLIYIRLT
ncbi:Chaperone protein DnaJ [Dirofilaria immitis]